MFAQLVFIQVLTLPLPSKDLSAASASRDRVEDQLMSGGDEAGTCQRVTSCFQIVSPRRLPGRAPTGEGPLTLFIYLFITF